MIPFIASFHMNTNSLTSLPPRQSNIPNLKFKSNDDDFVKEAITKKSSRVVKSTPITNLIPVDTLDEFKKVMKENKSNVVVVRLYATWCKSCASITPSFRRLARRQPKATFIDISITSKNTEDFQRAMNLPFVPYGHIFSQSSYYEYYQTHFETYHSVDEMKISKNDWNIFESSVKKAIDVE